MKFSTATVSAFAMAAGLAHAHMEMTSPAPFRSKFNKHVTNIEYTMNSPLGVFPCKGFHSDLGTPAGASVATWQSGSQQSFTVTGGASHGGGSCQASLSYDGGKTFKVIHSYIGNCPVNGESSLSFTVPAEAPGGEAIFAWTWFNKIGNREMYMNCAAVTIEGSGAGLDALPDIFVANVAAAGGCATSEGTDVLFPNPGPSVDNTSAGTGAPVGSCGTVSGAPAAAPVEAPAPPAKSPAAPAPTKIPGGVFLPNPVPTSSMATVIRPPPADPTPTPAPVPAPEAAPAPAPAPAPEDDAPEAAPAPAPQQPATGGVQAANSPCTNDGAWNCIGGTSFQRCASGTWTGVQPMAPGTECTSGVSQTFAFGAATRRHIRGIDRFAVLA
jgi:hypothetical protein